MFLLICKESHGVSVLHRNGGKVQPTPTTCAHWLNQNYSSILAILQNRLINQYGNASLCSSQMPARVCEPQHHQEQQIQKILLFHKRKYPQMKEELQFEVK